MHREQAVEIKPFAFIAVAALLVRGAALWLDRDALLFDTGGLDATEYLGMASGFWTGAWPGPRPFFWAPGYPLLLGVLGAVSDSLWWFKLVQVALGTATCVLVGRLAQLIFRNRAVSLLSACIAAVYGPLVYYDLQISPATLDAFLLVLLLVLVLEARARPGSWLWPCAAGMVAAASAITRGGTLLALPAVVVWFWRLPAADGAGASLGTRWRRCAGLTVPVLLTLGLVASHNWRHDSPFAEPVSARDTSARGLALVSNNLGINFRLGNEPELYAMNRVEHPRCFVSYKGLVDEPPRRGYVSESAKSRYLLRKGLRFIRQHPAEWLSLLARKVAELGHGQEISRDTSIYAARLDNPLLAALLWNAGFAFPSGLLIPFALAGLWATRRRPDHFVVLAFLASQAAFILCFFVTTRYRLPLCALSIPFAAHAAVALAELLRARELGRAAAMLGVLAALLLACNRGLQPHPSTHAPFEYVHLGLALAARGQVEHAADQWNAALQRDAGAPTAHFNLAELYAWRADFARAARHYEAGLQRAPDAYAAQLDYARLLLRHDRSDQALDHMLAALRVAPTRSLRRSTCALGKQLARDLEIACP